MCARFLALCLLCPLQTATDRNTFSHAPTDKSSDLKQPTHLAAFDDYAYPRYVVTQFPLGNQFAIPQYSSMKGRDGVKEIGPRCSEDLNILSRRASSIPVSLSSFLRSIRPGCQQSLGPAHRSSFLDSSRLSLRVVCFY